MFPESLGSIKEYTLKSSILLISSEVYIISLAIRLHMRSAWNLRSGTLPFSSQSPSPCSSNTCCYWNTQIVLHRLYSRFHLLLATNKTWKLHAGVFREDEIAFQGRSHEWSCFCLGFLGRRIGKSTEYVPVRSSCLREDVSWVNFHEICYLIDCFWKCCL